eukprot:TRINITY_DN14415_c0_g1_i9.p1 TRINITY_DN14415_c0_g1~~TRINITY_DN14415_c0_g1_i9.p1  ORF type:complete len:474 (+),score=93.72 TRINITY_DN14415_c0_g1_i9:32-1453(+)
MLDTLESKNVCRFRCICGSESPDRMFNLTCSLCGYFVHGICYSKTTGPVICTNCSENPESENKSEEARWKALEQRLAYALSKGEHKEFFGEPRADEPVSSAFLQLRFSIEPAVAQTLVNTCLLTGTLTVTKDGEVDYNTVKDFQPSWSEEPDKMHHGPNLSSSKQQKEDNISKEMVKSEDKYCDTSEELKSDPQIVPAAINNDNFTCQDETFDSKEFEEHEIKVEAEEEVMSVITRKCKKKQEKPLSVVFVPPTKHRPKGSAGPFSCDLCQYTALKKGSVKKHKESVHLNIRHKCPHCDHSATKKDHLKQHILSIHEGVRYNCDVCDFTTSDPSTLRKHKIHVHQGKKYYCDQCNYVCSRQNILTMHINNKHEGILYMCDQCAYQATCKSRLQHHKKSKHEGIRYPCDLCSYQAMKNSDLRSHKRRVHERVRYECDSCQYSASTPYLLKIHKESKHDGKVKTLVPTTVPLDQT